MKKILDPFSSGGLDSAKNPIHATFSLSGRQAGPACPTDVRRDDLHDIRRCGEHQQPNQQQQQQQQQPEHQLPGVRQHRHAKRICNTSKESISSISMGLKVTSYVTC